MGMTTHVVAYKEPDEKHRKMKAVWDACTAAKIKVPEEVAKFFGWETPSDLGQKIDEKQLLEAGVAQEIREESTDGFEIVVEKIPPGTKLIRVYNSY
jgi:hypothetical protein